MLAYRALAEGGVTTRVAADLTGVARATAERPARSRRRSLPRPRPANRLTDPDRAGVLDVLNSPEFVDFTPLQIYATLLDRGR